MRLNAVSLHLREQLKEAEGLLMGLWQVGDGATLLPRAPEKHASPAEAPNRTAARLQAARLPTCRPSSPVRQRVPTQGDDAAPVDPQHTAGHPADVSRHTWTEQITVRDLCFCNKSSVRGRTVRTVDFPPQTEFNIACHLKGLPKATSWMAITAGQPFSAFSGFYLFISFRALLG